MRTNILTIREMQNENEYLYKTSDAKSERISLPEEKSIKTVSITYKTKINDTDKKIFIRNT